MRRRSLYLLAALLGFALLALLAWGALTVALPYMPGNEPDVYATVISRRVAPSAMTASTPAPKATPNSTALARAMVDGYWQDRLAAATSLATRQDVPASDRAGELLAALDQEINHPTNASQPVSSYLSTTTRIRMTLCETLAALGPEGIAAWRQAATTKSGPVREWIVLGLGYAGVPDSVPSLRELLRKSQNGDVRMVAARLLGSMGVRDAVPDLKQALKDPHSVKIGANGSSTTIFPVREAAASALEKLGLSVRRSSDAGFVVVE